MQLFKRVDQTKFLRMEVIMQLVSKLLLIFFMLGLVSVCLPQKVLAERKKAVAAFHFFQSKANQGDANSQFNLALLYENGAGTPQNTKQAVYWYTKLAEQGHVAAQYKLGRLYRFSGDDDFPQDYKLAFFWYTKAAEKGHVFAEDERDKMLEKMSQSHIEEVQKLSKEVYEKIYNKAK
jgi:TPR repeat protein